MKKNYPRYLSALAAALAVLGTAAHFILSDEATAAGGQEQAQRPPVLDPDYREASIPPNIAPLNFSVEEPGAAYRVRVHAARGQGIEIDSPTPQIAIPHDDWKALLQANRGEDLFFDVQVRGEDGNWLAFESVRNRIATEEVDGYLAYRLLKPLYNKYVRLGIYQRHLESFAETTILNNRDADNACLNCHTFARNQPDPMILHTRGKHGLTMLVARGETVSTVHTRTEFNSSPAAYITWHPAGDRVVFSVNKLSLFFHTTGETRDVFDAASDLVLYRLDTNELTTTKAISTTDSLETWPTWAPDGRHLYFCRAPKLPIERFDEVRYDLMRIGYDPENGEWGELETVLAADRTGLTINQPKVSPDGRYLLATMAEYGNFPIFQESSDLYLIDLESGEYRRLEINSERQDTWHSWSTNGRWIVFSSKRRDGLFTRLYLSYFDRDGRFHKPFLLSQRDPTFYDSFIENYNVPEFVTGPVQVSSRALGRAIYNAENLLKAQLDPQVEVEERESASLAPEPYSAGDTTP